MRGIEEERLIEIYNNFVRQNPEYACLVRSIIAECKELNPWLPIEDAPKDRPLWLYTKDLGQLKGQWSNTPRDKHISNWQNTRGVIINPTHYQELPADPEE